MSDDKMVRMRGDLNRLASEIESHLSAVQPDDTAYDETEKLLDLAQSEMVRATMIGVTPFDLPDEMKLTDEDE